jgi:photosystem II stability/assembly factor-like uncharacterized protein
MGGLLSVLSYVGVDAQTAKTPDLQTEVLKQATWRSLGPALMGGRVADIAVDEKSPYTFFVALATGGLLKTTSNGVTWTPVFDKQPVASIGAVAIAPSDSKTVWVGTGEANGRNSSSWGNGVYKSTDGGTTWTHMGLDETQQIGRVVIDPAKPDVVYVAATGHLWGANRERGVFKTTDGGKTWQHVLAIDNDTGAIDLTFAPDNSSIVYAALYRRRRTAWGFEGFSDASGIYKSADAGKTWKRLTRDLPQKQVGRIGLSASRSKPGLLYAVIDCAEGSTGFFSDTQKIGGVFRSEDYGETWKRMSGKAPRGFYFGQIRVDPTQPDRVYLLGFTVAMSEDGGKTWQNDVSPGVHSDMHALWIDPTRPERLVLGTDGGVYASYDRGKSWSAINNFPAGEFYEVSVDNRKPYWVYGGLQDNGNWGGPSALYANSGPRNGDWVFLLGGDGFYVLADPTNPDIVYTEAQNGNVARIDRRINQIRFFAPATPEGVPQYRFNWNTPLVLSQFDHDKLYIGGNRLFTWTKKGTEWRTVGPDLSKQIGARLYASGSGAETYATIVSLAESPLKPGMLWAGTDDGNLQVTRDDGVTWTNLTNNLPEKVREYYVKRIVASRVNAERAYVAIDGHRSDDMAPYIFVTEDGGKSWRSLVGDLPKQGHVKALREDPINPNILYAGTEFGAFVSLDRGGKWLKLGSGLPTVAVDDIAIQARDRALVAATHGRSLWALDNLVPLQELTPQILASEVHLFGMAPGQQFLPADRDWFGGQGEFKAANPPPGVEIVYWMKALAEEPAKVVIKDAKDKEVTTLTGERLPGLHRLRWDMRVPRKEGEESTPGSPLFVKPGEYTVTLTVGKEKRTQKVQVTGPPELSAEEDKTATPSPAGASLR